MKRLKNFAVGIALGVTILVVGAAYAPAQAQDRQESKDRAERTERADRTSRRSDSSGKRSTPYSNRAQRREREAVRIQRRIDRDRKPKCFRCDSPD